MDVFFDNLVINLKHGPLVEQKDYYAFGMENPALSTQAIKYQYSKNRYDYNGKEIQAQEFSDSSGLNEDDYGARIYDPQIARMQTLDPKSEINRRWSEYVYCANNPIRNIDPDGMVWEDPKKDGETASRLKQEIKGRVKSETSNLASATKEVNKINQKIEKNGSSEKLQNNLKSALAKVDNINKTISNLNASSKEIDEMGSPTTLQKFTFKETSGEVGGTETDKNGTIVMTVTGGGDGNKIHELAHAYQQFKGTQSIYTNEREQFAYGRQYAFDGDMMNSTVPSFTGKVESYDDINSVWIIGIHDSDGNLIYAPPGYKKEDVEKLVK
jgi:RHS repeat-associated protein